MSLKDKLAGLAGRGGATPLGSSLATGFEAEHAKAQLATRGVDTGGKIPLFTNESVPEEIFSEEQRLQTLSEEFAIPFRPELPTDNLKTDFTKSIQIHYLRKFKMVPLETPEGGLIAVNDPSAFGALDDLCRIIGRTDFQVVLSTKNVIRAPSIIRPRQGFR